MPTKRAELAWSNPFRHYSWECGYLCDLKESSNIQLDHTSKYFELRILPTFRPGRAADCNLIRQPCNSQRPTMQVQVRGTALLQGKRVSVEAAVDRQDGVAVYRLLLEHAWLKVRRSDPVLQKLLPGLWHRQGTSSKQKVCHTGPHS